jgi:hypothetical protein
VNVENKRVFNHMPPASNTLRGSAYAAPIKYPQQTTNSLAHPNVDARNMPASPACKAMEWGSRQYTASRGQIDRF